MRTTTISDLELLVTIERCGSIGAAARALDLSQPTVSARLRKLERSLGLALVDRSAHGSTLTDQGRVVATSAHGVLTASDAFEAAVAHLRGAGPARLTVAASMTIAEHLVPGWLGRLRREDPRARAGAGTPSPTHPAIELLVRNSADVMRSVLDGTCELGFVEGPAVLTGLADEVVAHDELVVAVGAQHPWASRHRPLTPAELADAPLVLREKGSGTREVLERALARAGSHLPTGLPQLGSTASIRAALADGELVGVLSALAVVTELESGTLVRVPVEGMDLGRRLRLVTRRGAVLSPLATRLGMVARQVST